MDTLVEQLDEKFRVWQPEMANQVRQRIAEIIDPRVTRLLRRLPARGW